MRKFSSVKNEKRRKTFSNCQVNVVKFIIRLLWDRKRKEIYRNWSGKKWNWERKKKKLWHEKENFKTFQQPKFEFWYLTKVKSWILNLTKVKNWILNLTKVKNWFLNLTKVKNWILNLKKVKNWHLNLTKAKNWTLKVKKSWKIFKLRFRRPREGIFFNFSQPRRCFHVQLKRRKMRKFLQLFCRKKSDKSEF